MDNKDEQVTSQIIITFASPNSVLMDIQLHNVSPLQAITASWLLEKQAEGGFVQQEMARRAKEEMGHIAVPGGRLVKKP